MNFFIKMFFIDSKLREISTDVSSQIRFRIHA
jgi:hypothetical protein